MQKHGELIEFETARPANPLYCHQEFLEKLDKWRTQPIGKRASLLLQRLAIDASRVHFKATRGDNQGWRRSRLGGGSGSHFYAWWAPRSAVPLSRAGNFQQSPDGSLFVRDIRHHDDHSTLLPQSFEDQYLPVTVPEMRRQDYGPAPWTAQQEKFATAQNFVRLLKGHPGSGKTTALLHAADAGGAGRVLYVTYSPDLATLAKQYFDCYCDRNRQFHVVTYTSFLRQLLTSDAAISSERESRKKLRSDLQPFSRSLGVWAEHQDALYDEMHAHLTGGALPLAGGRFVRSEVPRLPDAAYKERRGRHLGAASGLVLDIASRLERAGAGSLAQRYFPELGLAWRAATALSAKDGPSAEVSREFLEFDCIAIDECQDLTALEAFVLVQLATAIRAHKRRPVQFLAAGDEAQTVRPTDFEWAWMSDMLHYFLMTPQDFHLRSNLRSPKQIAEAVNRVWDLYAEVEKKDRPTGTGHAEIDDDAADQIFYCTAAPGEELNSLLTDLAAREGLAIIAMEDTIPAAVPEQLRSSILTVTEAKGLDFHTVCLIDAGKVLDRILALERPKTSDLESIRRRLAIDRLRVALSRPTDRLIWLDVQPKPETVEGTLTFFEPRPGPNPMTPVLPSTVQAALAEEQLDMEERVQRCMADARQFMTIRPEIAWSRAQQAVSLLGDVSSGNIWVKDQDLREAAYRTLSEVCFRIAMSGVALPRELGSQNLLRQAYVAAYSTGSQEFSMVMHEIESVHRRHSAETVERLLGMMVGFRDAVPEWVLQGIAPKAVIWMGALEKEGGNPDNIGKLLIVLPPLYDMLGLPDAGARKKRLYRNSIQVLMQGKRYREALEILGKLPERDEAHEAECHRGMGNPKVAAELYLKLGKVAQAIDCYREVPDFDSAFSLIEADKDHPAVESYLWLKRLRDVLEEKPSSFSKVMTPGEQAMLQQMLEQGLGVGRKKPAAKKAAPKGQIDASVRRKVELYLKEHPTSRYCDDCLTTLTMVRNRPGVAAAAKDIAKEKGMMRIRTHCSHCGRSKQCAGVYRV